MREQLERATSSQQDISRRGDHKLLFHLQDSRREAESQPSVVHEWEVDPTEIDMKKSIPIGKVGLTSVFGYCLAFD